MIRYQITDQIRWATLSLDVQDSHEYKSVITNGNEFLRWEILRILSNSYSRKGSLLDPHKINAIDLDYALNSSGYQVDLLEGEDIILTNTTEKAQ